MTTEKGASRGLQSDTFGSRTLALLEEASREVGGDGLGTERMAGGEELGACAEESEPRGTEAQLHGGRSTAFSRGVGGLSLVLGRARCGACHQTPQSVTTLCPAQHPLLQQRPPAPASHRSQVSVRCSGTVRAPAKELGSSPGFIPLISAGFPRAEFKFTSVSPERQQASGPAAGEP